MKLKHSMIAAAFTCAAAVTVLGAGALIAWDNRPGVANPPPAQWPGHSKLRQTPGEMQLLVFMHPLCVCTAATLEELRSVLSGLSSRSTSKPHVFALFFRPAGNRSWKPGPTWSQAREEVGATVLWDDGGVEAKRFGVATSGAVLLYSASGKLLFKGGITGSRGHVGANNGMSQLAAALGTGLPDGSAPPVFGCNLAGPSSSGAAQ